MSRRTAVDFRGVRVSKHTRNMVLWAEKRAGFRFHIAQGSWSGAAASAGTHTGRVPLTSAQRDCRRRNALPLSTP